MPSTLIAYGLAVLLVTAALLAVSALLGERPDRSFQDGPGASPYESGIPPTGSARIPVAVHFYLMALFFVVFDLEAVFLFAWAVAARDLGWAGLAEASIFTAVLLAALLYLWRVGALELGPVGVTRSVAQMRRERRR